MMRSLLAKKLLYSKKNTTAFHLHYKKIIYILLNNLFSC